MCEWKFETQFYASVLNSPEATAFQFSTQKLSYSALAKRLSQLRKELGPMEGKRVVLLLPDLLETYVWYVFLFVSRAVTVPVSVQATSPRIKHIIDQVKPHLIVTTEFLRDTHAEALSISPCVVLKEGDGANSPGELEPGMSSLRLPRELEHTGTTREEKVRFIIFTSGSTGIPKGVCLSETNITAAADMMVDFLPLDGSTKSLVTVPLYDYYGLIQIFGHLLGRGSYILGVNPAFPKQFHRVLRDECVTDLVLVPHTLRKLTGVLSDSTKEGMSSLRRITSSSDMLTADLLARTFAINPEVTVINIYGLTEAGRACYRKINRGTAFSNSIGCPSKGVKVRLDNVEGSLGEIVLSGPNVMLGYFTGITEQGVGFKPCQEMRTGDLGCLGAGGEILLVGRKDHMFNLMGAKIHPSEIEAAALRLAGILEARARLGRNPDGQPSIELDVVLERDRLSTGVIREELKKSLPRMFVPTSVCIVPQIARTELGAKILR